MNSEIKYQIVRSQRKTLSLQVKQGEVLVRAPHGIDEEFINTFIKQKWLWLKSKIAQQKEVDTLCCDFSEGSTLFVFGQLTSLQFSFAKKSNVTLTKNINNQQILTITFAQRNQQKLSNKTVLATAVKKQIEKFFKEQAEELIPQRVAIYSQLTSLMPTSIKIRQYRSRWGSCNNRGELSFNYLLMMLPLDVIDYVIVHEICHLRHLNHSKNFWQLVAKYFPDYRQAKQWIKTNQAPLLWRLPLSN